MELRMAGHQGDVAVAEQLVAREPETTSRPQFREIYDEYFDFVYRCARRMGVYDKALDDAVQDVFVVVHRRLGDFEGRSSIKTWLYGITRRVAKDHRRRADRKEKGLVPAENLTSMEGDPREQAARAEAIATLREILDTLDAPKREVFVLAEMEQMTAPEIAEALAVNLNTVYSRLRAARAAFEKGVERHLARGAAQ
jgi:RNA polymerase sigma-70 factor (ECF subfamily)